MRTNIQKCELKKIISLFYTHSREILNTSVIKQIH